MSKCGYFCLEKGKAVCKHPENGEMWTKNGIQSTDPIVVINADTSAADYIPVNFLL